MIKHFIDHLINSIWEVKTKVFVEIGFSIGCTLSVFFNNAHLALLDMNSNLPFLEFALNHGYLEKIIDGILTGLGSGIGALLIAWIIKFYRFIKKRNKDDHKPSAS